VVEAPPPGTGALSLGLGRGSRERELIRQVGAPLPGTRRVVVLSIKGGVGKTTTVAVTGSLLAGLRRDKVVALDASSDWGTLATRLSVVPRQSVRELAANGGTRCPSAVCSRSWPRRRPGCWWSAAIRRRWCPRR
jgi:hypothetical protein